MSSFVSAASITTPEARSCVYGCLVSEDPVTAVENLIGDVDQATDPDVLKIAQYALLVPGAKRGISNYLEDPFEPTGNGITLSAVHEGVAAKSTDYVVEALRSDPGIDLAAKINQRRVELLNLQGKPVDMIEGIFSIMPAAARSAAITTTAAAYLVAAELQSSGKYEHADHGTFIEGVRSSGALARALTRLGRDQVRVMYWAIDLLAKEINRGERCVSPNAENLETRDGKASLVKNLQDWFVPNGQRFHNGISWGTGYHRNGSREQEEVKIGCLLSFAPELVTTYYQQRVDLLEKFDLWADELRAF